MKVAAIQIDTDEALEQRIQAAYDEWMEHGRERPGLWSRLADLIAQRSPEAVARMEYERGLR